MDLTILKGTIIYAKTLTELEIIENGYIVSENGTIVGVYQELPKQYEGKKIIDYTNHLILQTFSDMHLHGPQLPMQGMGYDLELLEWLNKYTYNTEAKFYDIDYAKKIYHQLAKILIKNGTTRVCMFSSLHKDATIILMDELEKAGISGFVGKVNMDLGPAILRETTDDSINNTLQWLKEAKRFTTIKPIITPRFTVSCSNNLLDFLGKTAKQFSLPIQSHLSENINEINTVKIMHPNCNEYYQTYEQFGLWNNKTLMAHCVWSNKIEQQAIKNAGVYVVHCANSNLNLCSGIAPIREMLNNGIKVVLGSDIAGGDKFNVFDIVNTTINTSKMKSILDPTHPKSLSIKEGWYLATSAPNEFFNEKPGIVKGNKLNVMIVNDDKLINKNDLTTLERFERLFYHRQDDYLKAVYSNGKKVY